MAIRSLDYLIKSGEVPTFNEAALYGAVGQNEKHYSIEATTVEDAWFQVIDLCYKKGNFQPVTKGSFEQGQKRKQLFKVSGILNNSDVRPFEPKIPEQYNIPAPVSEGYVENEYIRKLIDSTSKEEGEDYVYAEWIEPLYPKVIDRLLLDGFGTNQMYIPVGDVASFDLKDPPCLRGIDVKVVNNKLHYDVTFRSWDLWAGFPANLGGLQVLKEMMVYDLQQKGADIKDGKLGFNSCGAHIYGYAWDLAKQRLNIKEKQ